MDECYFSSYVWLVGRCDSKQNFDAVVGDTTIIFNRSLFVDFTLPYTESGVTMVVLSRENKSKAWIFLKPLSRDLWLMTGLAFTFTGFVVWVLEHRVNEEFRGPLQHQIGVILWFSFSTLVFAHSSVPSPLLFSFHFHQFTSMDQFKWGPYMSHREDCSNQPLPTTGIHHWT